MWHRSLVNPAQEVEPLRPCLATTVQLLNFFDTSQLLELSQLLVADMLEAFDLIDHLLLTCALRQKDACSS